MNDSYLKKMSGYALLAECLDIKKGGFVTLLLEKYS